MNQRAIAKIEPRCRASIAAPVARSTPWPNSAAICNQGVPSEATLMPDATNPSATRWMLRAWPWLALVALLVAGLLARQKPVAAPQPPGRTAQPSPAPTLAAGPTEPERAEPTLAPRGSEPPPPAAPAPEAQTTPAPDAPTPEAPAKPAPAPARPGGENLGTAILSVNATPWAEVSIDRRSQGTTPLRNLKLRAGNHVLRFVCPPLGRESEIELQIGADARGRIAVDLTSDPPRTFLDGVSKVR